MYNNHISLYLFLLPQYPSPSIASLTKISVDNRTNLAESDDETLRICYFEALDDSMARQVRHFLSQYKGGKDRYESHCHLQSEMHGIPNNVFVSFTMCPV